jgi:hypothetical protein
VDDVELAAELDISEHVERVGLVELEWVVGLRRNVHPDDVEACAVIAHRCTAGTTERVEQSRLHVTPAQSQLSVVSTSV